ncbi:MAG: gamma-glutamylcyclotransferase family protein [Rubrivivax sp.]|nr:gamma-glutamylcyclotransferase family protein [Rubrivivax sp.]
MAAPAFINFAYGSNMATLRLRARTPSAQPLGIARLPGHRLMWHKAGADGSAKCDILATGSADDDVWGVLFEIALHERPLLDRAEGLGRGYDHKAVTVHAAHGSVDAGAYHATHVDAGLRPFDWYLAYVVHGAREHGLPDSYRAELAAVAAIIDPDGERRRLNLALLLGA